jgi:hypothetical protein
VVEAGGAIVIFCGVVLAFVRFVATALWDRRAASFVPDDAPPDAPADGG